MRISTEEINSFISVLIDTYNLEDPVTPRAQKTVKLLLTSYSSN